MLTQEDFEKIKELQVKKLLAPSARGKLAMRDVRICHGRDAGVVGCIILGVCAFYSPHTRSAFSLDHKVDEILDPLSILPEMRRQRQTKEERLAQIQESREGRGKFGQRKGAFGG